MKAVIILAGGFEEVEALAPADILRRAGVEVKLVSADGDLVKKGARGIEVRCDSRLSDEKESVDCIILPGGNPGYKNLGASSAVKNTVEKYCSEGKLIAAICGAPTVLSEMGLLKDKRATCFPDLLDTLDCGEIVRNKKYVLDGNILTSQSVGTALDFALKLAELLAGSESASAVAGSIFYSYGE